MLLKKRHIIIALGIASLLLGSLFISHIILAQTGGEYDAWMDLNDDGIIDIYDLQLLASIYATSGTPINKTAQLLDLLDRVESLEAIIAYLSIIPNGDFEIDPTGTSYNDMSHWNHSSYDEYNGIAGENLEIVDDYYFSGGKSLYSYVKSGGKSQNMVYQHLWTESNVSTTSDYISLWIGGDGYTTSSRYWFRIDLCLTDGTNFHYETLRCKCWGNNEGCTPNDYDYYNTTETGADGRTWKRYTRTIPDNMDKSNLIIEIRHSQRSWDSGTASSWYRLDNIYFSDSEGNPTP